MKKQVWKAVLGVGLAGALASTSALALPDFTVDTAPYGDDVFEADKITGNYVEVITFGAGTFDVSIRWQAGQFVADDGTNPLISAQTGLGNDYSLYALFQGSGTFTSVGEETDFSLNTGDLTVYLDALSDQTTFPGQPVAGSPWARADFADDVVLANGSVISGDGRVTCIDGGTNCGSFGQTTTFELTAAGSNFFVSPSPFFNIAFQSGQFNGFEPSGTLVIQGSMDAWFGVVPEPAPIALLGIGMLAFGFAARKKQA